MTRKNSALKLVDNSTPPTLLDHGLVDTEETGNLLKRSKKKRLELSEIPAEFKEPPKQKLPIEKIHALIIDNQEHGRRLAWSFLTTWRIRMKQDEVISVVGAALCEAAHRFDDTRGVAFRTFFFYHLRGMLLKEISRMISEQRLLQYIPQAHTGEYSSEGEHIVSPSVIPVESTNPESLAEKKQISEICWEACSTLDPLEQEVIVRHFIYDEALIAIADELHYCRCHISRVKSRGLAKLKRMLGKAIDQVDPHSAVHDLSPEAKAAIEVVKRNYTGGRGRRRKQAALSKAATIRKIVE